MLGRQAKAYGCAVVHQVEAVAIDAELIDERLDERGQVVEAIVEFIQRRLLAVAEARVIRGHYVVFVRQRRDQIAEHVR